MWQVHSVCVNCRVLTRTIRDSQDYGNVFMSYDLAYVTDGHHKAAFTLLPTCNIFVYNMPHHRIHPLSVLQQQQPPTAASCICQLYAL